MTCNSDTHECDKSNKEYESKHVDSTVFGDLTGYQRRIQGLARSHSLSSGTTFSV